MNYKKICKDMKAWFESGIEYMELLKKDHPDKTDRLQAKKEVYEVGLNRLNELMTEN